MDTGGLTQLAAAIQNFLVQALIIAGPVSILLGFGMMFFGGFNPQWKQKGIEVIKWTIIGAIGVGLVATGLWAFIQAASGLGGGGGGGGVMLLPTHEPMARVVFPVFWRV